MIKSIQTDRVVDRLGGYLVSLHFKIDNGNDVVKLKNKYNKCNHKNYTLHLIVTISDNVGIVFTVDKNTPLLKEQFTKYTFSQIIKERGA